MYGNCWEREPMRKVLFLDRDGVINVDVNYLYRVEDLQFVAGAPEALAAAVKAGYDLIVVTNQSGIARGYYTEADMNKLHAEINHRLKAQGASILHFYYCPHHVKGAIATFTKVCDCRKPKPGMLLQAMADYDIDVTKSFMVGDKPSDVAAAEAAGLKGYLFEGTNLEDFLLPILQQRENVTKGTVK